MDIPVLGLTIALILLTASISLWFSVPKRGMEGYQRLLEAGVVFGVSVTVLVLFDYRGAHIGLLPFVVGAVLPSLAVQSVLGFWNYDALLGKALLGVIALVLVVASVTIDYLFGAVAFAFFWRLAVMLVFLGGVLFTLHNRWASVRGGARGYLGFLIIIALGLVFLLVLELTRSDRIVGSVQIDLTSTRDLGLAFLMILFCLAAVFYLMRFVHEKFLLQYQHELEMSLVSKGRMGWSREMVMLDRQRSLGLLANSLQHQLRQPLSAMKINAQIFSRLIDSNSLSLELGRSILRDIASEASRFHGKTKEIAQYVSPREESPVVFSLVTALEEVMSLIHPEMTSHKVEASFSFDSDIQCCASRIELQHAVLHVLMNAVEACSLQDPSEKRSISVQLSDNGDKALIKVCDSATGMSEAQIAQAGEEIFTSKPDRIGLGLLLVRQFLDNIGGGWRFSKKDGTFCVLLSIPQVKVTE